nr:DUF6160 family protein [Acinetobacter sp. Marseille-Q1620]
MKKSLILLLLAGLSTAHAELVAMDNADLQKVQGQAGADISLNLSLNQDANGQYDNGANGVCNNSAYCNLAVSLNNRFVTQQAGAGVNDTWTVASSTSGRKLWLVFKGIQGQINLQKLGLDGVDLLYTAKGSTNSQILKPAIQLSLSSAMPIVIKNFGFNAMSIEQDAFVTNADGSGAPTNPNDPNQYGYLKNATYASTNPSVYDRGKETGFTGMMINGNLAINGKFMMFSCDGTHPRC